MKTWLYILTTLLAFTLLTGIAENKDVPVDIFKAVEQGNSEDLSYFFNQSINLSIMDKSGLYSKKQAEIILDNFFTENEIKNFEIIQQKEQANFSSAICKVKNQNNSSFNIYLTIYEINNKQVITNLSITLN